MAGILLRKGRKWEYPEACGNRQQCPYQAGGLEVPSSNLGAPIHTPACAGQKRGPNPLEGGHGDTGFLKQKTEEQKQAEAQEKAEKEAAFAEAKAQREAVEQASRSESPRFRRRFPATSTRLSEWEMTSRRGCLADSAWSKFSTAKA